MKVTTPFSATVLFLCTMSLGCKVENKSEEQIKSLKSSLARVGRQSSEMRKQRDTAFTAAYDAVIANGSIYDLENYLGSLKCLPSNEVNKTEREGAYHQLWKITRQLDVWDGYVYLVTNHSDAPAEILKKANSRMSQLALKSALIEDKYEAYVEFLRDFRTAPVANQKVAIEKACEKLGTTLVEQFGSSAKLENREQRDAAGTTILTQALQTKSKPEKEAKLLIIHYLMTESKFKEYFADTPAMVDLLSRTDIMNELAGIKQSIESLRNDVQKLREELVRGIQSIQAHQNVMFAKVISNQQSLLDEIIASSSFPFYWDDEKTTWENLSKMSAAAIPYFAAVGLDRIIP